jgi:hypothetical protein
MPKTSQYWTMEERELKPDFSLTKKLANKGLKGLKVMEKQANG